MPNIGPLEIFLLMLPILVIGVVVSLVTRSNQHESAGHVGGAK